MRKREIECAFKNAVLGKELGFFTRLKYKGASLDLDLIETEDTKYLELYRLQTKKSLLRKGRATNLLNIVIKLADKYGVSIVLWAGPFGHAQCSVENLIKFYAKIGFKLTDCKTRKLEYNPLKIN